MHQKSSEDTQLRMINEIIKRHQSYFINPTLISKLKGS